LYGGSDLIFTDLEFIGDTTGDRLHEGLLQ
jgi:hypothetical protein